MPDVSVAYVVVAVFLGSNVGSLAAAFADRAGDRAPVSGPSRCACGHKLRPWHLVPIFSWAAFRGRARCCGARIPAWYLWWEVAGAALWLLPAFAWGEGTGGAVAMAASAAWLAFGWVPVRRRREAAGTAQQKP